MRLSVVWCESPYFYQKSTGKGLRKGWIGTNAAGKRHFCGWVARTPYRVALKNFQENEERWNREAVRRIRTCGVCRNAGKDRCLCGVHDSRRFSIQSLP